MANQNNSCQPCTPQVMMFVPPSICPPTQPQPVRPLQLPQKPEKPKMSDDDMARFRYSNFYNNYNIDYKMEGNCVLTGQCPPINRKRYCESYENDRKRIVETNQGCPTGFKPCVIKMMPPPCGNPLLPWIGEVQPCPPKPKKKNDIRYIPEPCTKPCCRHWKPKQPPCIYDKPCKAHCYNQPVTLRSVWHEFNGSNSCKICS